VDSDRAAGRAAGDRLAEEVDPAVVDPAEADLAVVADSEEVAEDSAVGADSVVVAVEPAAGPAIARR